MRTDDIVNKVFARSFMGYDVEQVDAFLDELIDCIERYESEKREMLSAIEYLLGKLENGKQLPIAEMRKAIGEAKPKPRRTELPERASAAARDEAERAPSERGQDARLHAKTAARSVPRQSGAAAANRKRAQTKSLKEKSTPAKPVRAPRVKRVAKSAPEPVAIEYETNENAPDKENWLDELLSALPADRKGTREPKEKAGRVERETEPAAESAAKETREASRETVAAPTGTAEENDPARGEEADGGAPEKDGAQDGGSGAV